MSSEANQLRKVVTTDKGELKFAALAPDVKLKSSKALSDLSKTVNLKGTEESGDQRFLLAYDDHAEGELAYKHVLRAARPGDHVFFVQVLEINKSDAAYLEESHVLVRMNDIVEQNLRAKAQAFLDKGLDVTLHIAHGEPKAAICALADFHRVDVIVLGRRKLGRVQRLMSSSSVSQYVLTHANQTVTIAKA